MNWAYEIIRFNRVDGLEFGQDDYKRILNEVQILFQKYDDILVRYEGTVAKNLEQTIDYHGNRAITNVYRKFIFNHLRARVI